MRMQVSFFARPVAGFRRILFAFGIFALMAPAQAQSLVFPSGLAVDPDVSLDLTYQVIPDYDPLEKVVAGWIEGRLQYFVTVQRLPPEWSDHNKYFQGFVRDLRAAGRLVETGESGSYRTTSPLTGHYLQIHSKPAPRASTVKQLVHFIGDGKTAFLAIATLVEKGDEGRMLQETKRLFQSVSLPEGIAIGDAGSKAESPYVGTWVWNGPSPNGVSVFYTMTLNSDLSFSVEMKMGGKVVFVGAGVWQLSGKALTWRYLRSQPQLPEDKREDDDEIVSHDRGRLVLRSRSSGMERTFLLQ